MLNITFGENNRNCAGVSRRDALKVGMLTAGGMTLGDVLRTRAAAASNNTPTGNKKSVICFWLDGGPTHHETFDPKYDAPSEYKGPYNAIQTAAPGIHLCELFPQTAMVMDKLSIIRSVHHNNGDHYAAAHWMLTGYHGSNGVLQDPMFPSVGAVTSKVNGANKPGLPAYVAVPYAATVGLKPGYTSGAFLGVSSNPFSTGGNPNSANFQVQNLNPPKGVNADRMMDRKTLLSGLDRVRRNIDSTGLMEGIDQFNQQAFDLITGDAARKAFDINSEDPKLRDRYGRTVTGQCALLARRLVESGVTFVSIHAGSWDNHGGIELAMKRHAAYLDPALATLTDDLDQRGMLDDVIIMVMGEFGRTPRINANAGRDHWGNAMSVLLGGGGINPGQVVGATDKKGARPIKRAVKPAHVLHTVYHQLGIDTSITHINRAGRPIPILGEGEPIRELL